MCGIAGLFRPEGLDPEPLGAMVGSLAHRGPDDEGSRVFRDEGGRAWAAIGARRLAIVDPAGGDQPASDGSGRFCVTLNGEVYNHRHLRAEMAEHGAVFRSASDTEVVAHLVGQVSLRTALERMRGMFALAIADTRERRVFLVRDRMGKKPLYWTRLPDGTVAWASELRGLLAHPAARRRLDERAVRAYLLFEYVPSPWSIYEGIHKLEPGTCLELGPDGVRTWRWWTPPVPHGPGGGALRNWALSLHGALQVAVLHRMQADVEVGYLLSGGIDSTAVVAMAQARRREPVRTFSVSVDSPGFDEGGAARRVAASLGTEHREVRLVETDLDRVLDAISAHLDEPLADSSLVPTWRLMELVREAGLKCVLSGDGADESLAGYPTCTAHLLAGPLAPARGLVRFAGRRLRTSFEGVTRDYMARRFADGLGLSWARRQQVWMGAWLPEEVGAGEEVWEVVDAHAEAAGAADPVSRCMYLDQRLYLADGVLVKVDRASMAQGVEVRSPFLDHALVELAAQMPVNAKLRGRTTKLVLREAVRDLVPPETLARKKHGFGAPTGPWLRGPCRGLLERLDEQVERWVPGDLTRRCAREHVAGTADHRRRLWSALVLARWLDGPWGP